MEINRVYQGNALEIMKAWPDQCISCIVTSPPYWNLRFYHGPQIIWGGDPACSHDFSSIKVSKQRGGKTPVQITNAGSFFEGKHSTCSKCGAWKGELGMEPTRELYLAHLAAIFAECQRVLRKDGVMFVNIGDTYGGLQKKSLSHIPELLVLELEGRGWIHRSTIIWAKGVSFARCQCEMCGGEARYSGSCMPDSTKDRPNKNGFEYVYMFTKSPKYWYEQQTEPCVENSELRYKYKFGGPAHEAKSKAHGGTKGPMVCIGKRKFPSAGRNLRNVWAIITGSGKGKHFAVFPQALVEPLIRMGCPERICAVCGRAAMKNYKKQFVGWKECDCDPKQFVPGVVLDPFGGSGTTGIVAKRLGRSWVIIEAVPEYAELCRKNLENR